MLQRKVNDLGKISHIKAGLLELAICLMKNEENMNKAIMAYLISSVENKSLKRIWETT